MKFLYLVLLVSVISVSCSRKAVPEKTHETSTSPSATTAPAEEKPTVMVDGSGNVVNSSVKTSTGKKVYPVTSARSFTPAQKQNLMYRYKTVPPKVIHVPESLAKKNARGTYYVYKSKFWYWKKGDGYFHLDENYYN